MSKSYYLSILNQDAYNITTCKTFMSHPALGGIPNVVSSYNYVLIFCIGPLNYSMSAVCVLTWAPWAQTVSQVMLAVCTFNMIGYCSQQSISVICLVVFTGNM